MNTHRPFNSCFHPIVHPHSSLLHGQLVWTEPRLPTVDDQVTLYYNSALNGELQGVIPDYIHTGVITSNSSGPSDWQNVQTAWGTSDPLALLNPEGNGIHTFDFNGLTLNDYYQLDEGNRRELGHGLPQQQRHFVGRNADGSDIFYEVSSIVSTSLQTPKTGTRYSTSGFPTPSLAKRANPANSAWKSTSSHRGGHVPVIRFRSQRRRTIQHCLSRHDRCGFRVG